jgi:hypothetical protein
MLMLSEAVVFRKMLPKMRLIREKPFSETWMVDEMAGVQWKGGNKDCLDDQGYRLRHDHLGLGRRGWLERYHGDASLCRHPIKDPEGGLGGLQQPPRRAGCQE